MIGPTSGKTYFAPLSAEDEDEDLAIALRLSMQDPSDEPADNDLANALAHLELTTARVERSITESRRRLEISPRQQEEEALKIVQTSFMQMLLGAHYVIDNTSFNNDNNRTLEHNAKDLMNLFTQKVVSLYDDVKRFFDVNFDAMKSSIIDPISGNSRLHVCVEHFNNNQMMAFLVLAQLLRCGCDPTHKNIAGQLPLDLVSPDKRDILEALFSGVTFEKDDILAIAVGFDNQVLTNMLLN